MGLVCITMALTRFQERRLYDYRVNLYRVTQDLGATSIPDARSWALVKSAVKCYKSPNPSTQGFQEFGRIESDNLFSMDVWDFDAAEDVRVDDVFRNVTLLADGTTQAKEFGEFWTVRGEARAYERLGPRRMQRSRFMASKRQSGPEGTDILYKLSAAWPLDTLSGTTPDATGNGHTLTAVGDPTLTASSKVGAGAIVFDGVGDVLTAPDHADFHLTAGRSFTAWTWVNLSSKASSQTMMSKWNATGSQQGWAIEYDSGADRFRVRATHDGSTIVSLADSNLGSPSTSTWYLVFGGYDADEDELRLRLGTGASLLAEEVTAHTLGVFDSSEVLRLGASGDAGSFLTGSLDEPGYSEQPLTGGLMTEVWNAGAGKAHPYI